MASNPGPPAVPARQVDVSGRGVVFKAPPADHQGREHPHLGRVSDPEYPGQQMRGLRRRTLCCMAACKNFAGLRE